MLQVPELHLKKNKKLFAGSPLPGQSVPRPSPAPSAPEPRANRHPATQRGAAPGIRHPVGATPGTQRVRGSRGTQRVPVGQLTQRVRGSGETQRVSGSGGQLDPVGRETFDLSGFRATQWGFWGVCDSCAFRAGDPPVFRLFETALIFWNPRNRPPEIKGQVVTTAQSLTQWGRKALPIG